MHKGDRQHRRHGSEERAQADAAGGSDYYFDSYAHLGIHEEMIKDTVRTNTYRTAILGMASHLWQPLICSENNAAFNGKVVLDVGCGTGILSFFCLQAGARTVYGVEASDMADHAKAVVEANGVSQRIHILKGRMEDIVLPEKVDIIVSEWMGYFLIYETMLDSVLLARDRWLKPVRCSSCEYFLSDVGWHYVPLTCTHVYCSDM